MEAPLALDPSTNTPIPPPPTRYAGKAIGKHVFQKNEENRVISLGMMPPTSDLEVAFLRVCMKKQGE